MAALVEEDSDRLLKAVAYITIVEDYCKQIVRESPVMNLFQYDIINDINSDDKITTIIKNNFYSTKNSLCLKLAHVPHPNGPYVDLRPNGRFYSDSLKRINGYDVPANWDIDNIIYQHEKDLRNIGKRDFKDWVINNNQFINLKIINY